MSRLRCTPQPEHFRRHLAGVGLVEAVHRRSRRTGIPARPGGAASSLPTFWALKQVISGSPCCT